MNKLLKLTPIILALTLLVGCGESSPMAVEPDPTSSVVNGSATVVSSGTVLVSSATIVSSSSTGSDVVVSSSATTTSSSTDIQPVSSSSPAGYLPGYRQGSYGSPDYGADSEYLKTFLNKPFSLENCAWIDTVLPHGINPAYLNFISMIQESETKPANYDSLLTTMSVLSCWTGATVTFEVTHPGNSNTGLIPTWYAINFRIGAGSFGTEALNPDMEKVVMQHAGLTRADVGKNGVVFLATAFDINRLK